MTAKAPPGTWIGPDPQDRRARVLSLTDAGRAVLARAVPIWTREHGAMVAEWSDQELKDPARLLRKFVDGANAALKA